MNIFFYIKQVGGVPHTSCISTPIQGGLHCDSCVLYHCMRTSEGKGWFGRMPALLPAQQPPCSFSLLCAPGLCPLRSPRFAPASPLQRDGTRVLATPPLAGTILPGITRDSILQLARSWGAAGGVDDVVERRVTLAEVQQVRVAGRQRRG